MRIGIAAALTLAVLAVAVVATARPGDPRLWPPAPGKPTVRVWVVNHGYHAGMVIPRRKAAVAASQHEQAQLTAVAARFGSYDWLEIGWGEEDFYRNVPTAASLTIGLGLRALFSSDNKSVLHVVGLDGPPERTLRNADLVSIDVSEAGFARMLARIDASIAVGADGMPTDLGRGLYGASRFFAANGRFHLFNVCNNWIADLLDAAGLPTAPILSVLPHGLLLDLKWRAGLVPVTRLRAAGS